MVNLRQFVAIHTRYGPAERDCYCSAAGGRFHHEQDSSWLAEREEAQLADEQREARRLTKEQIALLMELDKAQTEKARLDKILAKATIESREHASKIKEIEEKLRKEK